MDEALTTIHARLLAATDNKHFRYLYPEIDWNDRLLSIVGARGTGKTTLLLQYIKYALPSGCKALYVSLDNIWFSKNSLFGLADMFNAYGGTHLFIDEVHRYPTWAIEVKNIYDSFPDMHVAFTGSSILEIYKSNADLSRRAMSYNLHGLSFREFLNFETPHAFEAVLLSDIVEHHVEIASEITSKVKVLPYFRKYLEYGYYPFYKQSVKSYPIRLQQIINTILDNDLPSVESIEPATVLKIKKLLMIIAGLVPFSPNITTLSADIETNRASTIRYLDYLQKAELVRLLQQPNRSLNVMAKPEKIYLNNTNIAWALAASNSNVGNMRETFFANQLATKHTVSSARKGDFMIDGALTFEVGGRGKSFAQISDLPSSYIAMDDIETGFGNKIPLWLFGFMY